MKAVTNEIYKSIMASDGFYSAYQAVKGLHFLTNCITYPQPWLSEYLKNADTNN